MGKALTAWVATRRVDQFIAGINPGWDAAGLAGSALPVRNSVMMPCLTELFSTIGRLTGMSMDQIEHMTLGAEDGDAVISRIAAEVGGSYGFPIRGRLGREIMLPALEASRRRSMEPLGRLSQITKDYTPLEEGARADGRLAGSHLEGTLAAFMAGPACKVVSAARCELD